MLIIMDDEEEGRQAAATIESLSIGFHDPSETLLVSPSLTNSLTDPKEPAEDDIWDNVVFDTSAGNTFINVEDDVLTVNLPPNAERTASEQFADAMLEQIDMHDASVADEGDVVASNEVNIPSPLSVPVVNRLTTDEVALEFVVTVEGGRHSSYVFKNNTLYTRMNTEVIFMVHCPVLPPQESFIRICAVYAQNIYENEPIRRCAVHRSRDPDKEEHMEEHLILVDNMKAQYLTEFIANSEKTRPFVIVPFDALPPNNCILLKFRCYSSCAGGINRRPVVLCFSLENGERLLGHSEMQLKICSMPCRDANSDTPNLPRGRPRIRRSPKYSVENPLHISLAELEELVCNMSDSTLTSNNHPQEEVLDDSICLRWL